MEVYTDRESVVIYTTNYPEADKELLSGGYLKKNDAICFEAQSIPIGEKDSFLKSSYLEKDKKYKATTMFKFFF